MSGYVAYQHARKVLGAFQWAQWEALNSTTRDAWNRAFALANGEPDPFFVKPLILQRPGEDDRPSIPRSKADLTRVFPHDEPL